MEGNPTGCMGLPDYLGWQWKSKASIPVNVGDFALFQFLNRTAKQPKRELPSTPDRSVPSERSRVVEPAKIASIR
jgi:hypothetical protein